MGCDCKKSIKHEIEAVRQFNTPIDNNFFLNYNFASVDMV